MPSKLFQDFTIAAAALAFSGTAVALDNVSYWKHPQYDAVVKIWDCPERGICGVVHSVNPQDKKVRAAVGKILEKDPDKVSDADVLSFCNYAGDAHVKKAPDNNWYGDIFWPYRDRTYGLILKEPKAETMQVRGYILIPLLGKTVTLQQVKNPPPACKK